MKWVKRFFLCLLSLPALAGAGALLAGWLSLPQTDGEARLYGLNQPVEILRDRQGIPTIRAKTSRDAYFALGFSHAQDRLWQMEMTRRVGAGRLSEILGADTLGIDRFMRTMGFYRLAEAQAGRMAGDVRDALEAYAEGVNASLAKKGRVLPPEFLVLGHKPEPWAIADSIVWSKLMAFQLSNDWRSELLKLSLTRQLDPARVMDLFPGREERPVVTGQAAEAVDFAQALLDGLPDQLKSNSASNAWVLAGNRTESGLPVLANDPHLKFSSPILWYLARIETPDWEMTGATVPGVPIHVLGHNGHLAWGLTTTHADTQDVMLLKLEEGGAGDPDLPNERGSLANRIEEIRVKGGDIVQHRVRSLSGAVVISDILSELREALPENEVALLYWPGFLEDDRTVEAVFAMNRAGNLQQFQEAVTGFHAPIQNVHYADVRGNIALFVPGRIPVRGTRDGSLPVRFEDPDSRWTGFIPQRELPRIVNPGSGLIVNANNRLVPADYPYSLTAVWPASYRVERITGQLAGGLEPLDMARSASLQNDILSLPARNLSPYLLRSLERADRADLADRMAGWDFRMAPDRPEAALYAVWERRLVETVLADDLAAGFHRYWRGRPRLLTRVMAENDRWCDDIRTSDHEDCAAMSDEALALALGDLAAWLGEDWRDWRWGDLHQGRFGHDIFKHVPVADRLFGRVLATGGGDHTVNRGQTGAGGGRDSYRHHHGAGYRALYDLSDLKNSRFAIAGGQSGHPLSAWFASLLEGWRDGDYVRIDGGGMEGFASRSRRRELISGAIWLECQSEKNKIGDRIMGKDRRSESELLLVIDVQNDFCPGGALAVPDGDAVVPLVNRLQGAFSHIVLTQDWHPAGHHSFASAHDGKQPFELAELSYGTQVLWPDHCVQGTSGAAFHEDLETGGAAMIIRKGYRSAIDSYSAFFENDQVTPTGLSGYVRDRAVKHVYLAGLATDFCVLYSALDARKLGLEVTVVEDACRAIDLEGSLQAAWDAMSDAGIARVRSSDLA